MKNSNESHSKVITHESLEYVLLNENVELKMHTYISSFSSEMRIESRSDERTVWNTSLAEITEKCFDSSVESVLHCIEELSNSLDSKASLSIVTDAENAFNRYVQENLENKLNALAMPSKDSLFQLSRFIPELHQLHSTVYVDEESGCFGVVLRSRKKSRPILNLLMRSDKEVTFSFIKKEKGVIKISGRAYFNEHLDDSKEINNLLRMLKS